MTLLRYEDFKILHSTAFDDDDSSSKTEYRVVVGVPQDLHISSKTIDISEDVLTAIFQKSALSEPWNRKPTNKRKENLSLYLQLKIKWLRSSILTGQLYRNSHRIAIIVNSGILAKKQDKSFDRTPNELYLMLWWNENSNRWSLIDPKLSIISAHVALHNEEKMRHRISQIIALAEQTLEKKQNDPVISGPCCLSSAKQDLKDRISERNGGILRSIQFFPSLDFQLTGNTLPSTVFLSTFSFDRMTRIVIDDDVNISQVAQRSDYQKIMQNSKNPAQCMNKAVEKAVQIAHMIPEIAIPQLPSANSLKTSDSTFPFFLPLCFDESFKVHFAALLEETGMNLPGPKPHVYRTKGYGASNELVYKVQAVFGISEASTYARLLKPFSSDDSKPDTWLIHKNLSKILTPTQQTLVRGLTNPGQDLIVSLKTHSSTSPDPNCYSNLLLRFLCGFRYVGSI